MKIFENALQLIGNTPIVKLSRFSDFYGIPMPIYAKLERFNPAGSIKDRAALGMLDDYERRGLIKKGSVIIEPTSGNTGIGLAAVAAVRGYRVVLTMPDSMSIERRKLLAAYGAELVLTPGKLGMQGAVDKANELCREIPDSIIAGQFVNPANPQAHYETTGPEIYADTDGQVDILVCGIGTGGTITGTGRYLKEKKPSVRVVAYEPSDSPLLSEGKAGPHKIQGVGANFIPDALDRSVIDEIVKVDADDAFAAGRLIAKSEGILVGISSGAALHATAVLAKRPENFGKTIVTVLPDTGERYLSSELFE